MTDWNESAVMTALCLWECIVDPPIPDLGTPWQTFRDECGTFALRQEVIGLAAECDARWDAMDEEQQTRHEPFDWEWCPIFLTKHVQWDEDGAHLIPAHLAELSERVDEAGKKFFPPEPGIGKTLITLPDGTDVFAPDPSDVEGRAKFNAAIDQLMNQQIGDSQ